MTFSLEELLTMFSLLKKKESSLDIKERQLLTKIQKKLYEHLSIKEIEEIENQLGGM